MTSDQIMYAAFLDELQKIAQEVPASTKPSTKAAPAYTRDTTSPTGWKENPIYNAGRQTYGASLIRRDQAQVKARALRRNTAASRLSFSPLGPAGLSPSAD